MFHHLIQRVKNTVNRHNVKNNERPKNENHYSKRCQGFRCRDVGASHARQKPASDQVLDYASVDLHHPKPKYGPRKTNKTRLEGGDLLLLSGGNRVIGSILPASVLTAFRRGSLVSSSQHYVPPSDGEKKQTGISCREKIFRIANKQRKIRWLSSAGKSAYRSISYTERPVIWSVELEFYRVVTAISLDTKNCLRRTERTMHPPLSGCVLSLEPADLA